MQLHFSILVSEWASDSSPIIHTQKLYGVTSPNTELWCVLELFTNPLAVVQTNDTKKVIVFDADPCRSYENVTPKSQLTLYHCYLHACVKYIDYTAFYIPLIVSLICDLWFMFIDLSSIHFSLGSPLFLSGQRRPVNFFVQCDVLCVKQSFFLWVPSCCSCCRVLNISESSYDGRLLSWDVLLKWVLTEHTLIKYIICNIKLRSEHSVPLELCWPNYI